MADGPAVNASPLIFLARANLLDLLQLAGPDIVVPTPVADEILREGPEDAAAGALHATPWMKIVEAPPVPPVVQAWDMAQESRRSSHGRWSTRGRWRFSTTSLLGAALPRCTFRSEARSG